MVVQREIAGLNRDLEAARAEAEHGSARHSAEQSGLVAKVARLEGLLKVLFLSGFCCPPLLLAVNFMFGLVWVVASDFLPCLAWPTQVPPPPTSQAEKEKRMEAETRASFAATFERRGEDADRLRGAVADLESDNDRLNALLAAERTTADWLRACLLFCVCSMIFKMFRPPPPCFLPSASNNDHLA